MAEARSVVIAAQAAIVDRATAQVARALHAEGIRCLLLKGPVLGRWLYDGEQRPYADVDLLVSPPDRGRAEGVLRGLGYAPTLDDADVPPFDRELHARTWATARGPAVDLHRTIAGAGAPPEAVWAALSHETESTEVDGATIEVLAVPARALLVALHAAHHGAREPKPLEDLSRAVERLDGKRWAAAAELAGRVAATDAFAAGLRLLPDGRVLAGELGLPPGGSPEVALRAGASAPLALQLEWLHQARGVRAKAALLLRLLFPPRAWMEPPPATRRPRLALAWAYLKRMAMLRHAPRALSAWRRASRTRGRSSGT